MNMLHSKFRELNKAYALIVTTNDCERVAVLDIFDHYRFLGESEGCRWYVGDVDERLVVVADGPGGVSHPDAVARAVVSFLSDNSSPMPAFVLICGLAWGNPSRTNIGDVIIATSVLSANRTRKVQNLHNLIRFSSNFADGFVASSQSVVVHYDTTIISAEHLHSDSLARDGLLQLYPADGGDMEAFFLAPECDRRNLPWLIVKGISDHGGSDFNRDYQGVAARNAAQIASDLVMFHGIRPADRIGDERNFHVALLDQLRGRTIVVAKDWIGGSTLVYLRELIGQWSALIEWFTCASSIEGGLALSITQFLHEVSYNSFRHGNASRIEILLEDGRVLFKDDAREYDVRKLGREAVRRGGAMSLRALKRRYVEHGYVDIAYKANKGLRRETGGFGNRYDINLMGDVAAAKSRQDCEVSFSVDFAQGSPPIAIAVNPDCKEWFIDLSEMYSYSEFHWVIEKIVLLSLKGIKMYIYVGNEEHASHVLSEFTDQIESGMIVILPRHTVFSGGADGVRCKICANFMRWIKRILRARGE